MKASEGTSPSQFWCSTGPYRSISIVRSQATDSTIPDCSSRWKNRKPRTATTMRHNAATPPIRRGVFADGARAAAAGGGGSAAGSAEPQLEHLSEGREFGVPQAGEGGGGS